MDFVGDGLLYVRRERRRLLSTRGQSVGCAGLRSRDLLLLVGFLQLLGDDVIC